mmetsp:Transcript_35777/g.75154  ORF Transcript_35777/g.75154 Transcript_35777/m.75154 type:complete len:257 (-) Transcript_35777:132-902(-)
MERKPLLRGSSYGNGAYASSSLGRAAAEHADMRFDRADADAANADAMSVLFRQPVMAQAAFLEGLDPMPAPSAARSVVTSAVLGDGLPSLHGLPPELLLKTFSMLDPLSLCRLARVSVMCRRFADDLHVWREACGCQREGRVHAGHCKELARLRDRQAKAIREEERSREARRRKQQWRLWKRRVCSCLQALCGVTFVLVPFILMLKKHSATASSLSNHASAKGSAGLPPNAVSHAPRYDQIVWAAATCKPVAQGAR